MITADTARALTQAAGTVRILIINDPPSGPPPDEDPPPDHGGIHHHSPDCATVLDFGRTTYRPPAAVADRVHTRDARCRFPGCALPATRCDIDHRTPWDHGGATCPCNLDTLCRYHHRIKTFTGWTAHRDHTTNTLTWTSPLGRVHTDRAAPDLPTGTALNLSDHPLHGFTPQRLGDRRRSDDRSSGPERPAVLRRPRPLGCDRAGAFAVDHVRSNVLSGRPVAPRLALRGRRCRHLMRWNRIAALDSDALDRPRRTRPG